jgi:class 3 adenylate cyclase
MCAWFKSRGRKPPGPPEPRPFSGIGVYLTSEVHSARSSRGRISPVALVDALAGILEYQSAIIESHGGIIEQFVGDCVVAYWEPGDPTPTANSAYEAAKKILRGKSDIAGVEFRLRVNFSLADMAGAFFGPASGRRFQVIGKARDRANGLPRFSPGADCIFTDAETMAQLPDPARAELTPFGPKVYSLRIG